MADPIDPAALAQAWMHSREEDTATQTVYRPAAYPFPPARGRGGFELRPDGTSVDLSAGPADRSVGTKGAWRLTDGCLTLDVPGRTAPLVLEIEAVEADRLVVRKPARACPAPGTT